MPITINGTTVTTNSINGTSISSETVNGTLVYGGTLSKVWVLIYQTTSEPSVDLNIIESSSAESYFLSEITTAFPPNNYAVNTTGCVWDGYSMFNVYQIQEV